MAGRIAVVGEESEIALYRGTDAIVYAAEDPDAVLAAWRSLPDDVDVVIVTAAAATCIDAVPEGSDRRTIVLPMQPPSARRDG
jgi:vacuolar-type H+-ATPase subunit F/Vma7